MAIIGNNYWWFNELYNSSLITKEQLEEHCKKYLNYCNNKGEEMSNLHPDLELILQDVLLNKPSITDWEINHEFTPSYPYGEETTVKFTYHPGTGKSKSIDELAKAYFETAELLKREEENEMSTTTQATTIQESYEFTLGDVFLVKNGLDNVCDGEVILAVSGYTIDNFIVNDGVDCINVIAIYEECPNCGEPVINEFCFDLNPNYKVKSKKKNVRDGLFILKVEYDTENNIEVDESL